MTTSGLPGATLRDCINGEDDQPPEIEIVSAWIAYFHYASAGVDILLSRLPTGGSAPCVALILPADG